MLDLSRLTAVTKLDLSCQGDRPVHLYPCDKLPPNTQWLSLDREHGWAMLPVVTQLSCLTYLEFSPDRLTEAELGMLHQLTTLQASRQHLRSHPCRSCIIRCLSCLAKTWGHVVLQNSCLKPRLQCPYIASLVKCCPLQACGIQGSLLSYGAELCLIDNYGGNVRHLAYMPVTRTVRRVKQS